ncbi:MAG: DUF2232 domain-containing protein [Erysipelotrichaceae bacterium]
MNNNVKKISDGAMMMAIVGVALFFNRQTGMVFELILNWFMALPIMIYCVKYGFRSALLPAFGMVVLAVILATPQTHFYLGCSLLIGLAYGHGVRQKWAGQNLLALTIGVTLFSYLMTTVLFAGFFGYDLGADIQMLQQVLQSLPFSNPQMLGNLVLMLLFLTTILTAVLEGFVIHMFGTILLQRLKFATQPLPSIVQWRLPKGFGWFSLIVLVLSFGSNLLALSPSLNNGIMFLYLIVSMVNILYGASVAAFLLVVFDKRKYVWLVALAVFIPFANNLLLILGIFDTVQDLKGDIKRGIMHDKIS